MVNYIFSQQIGRNVKVYVNDILEKTNDEIDHLDNLRETFNMLHKYKMKQNPMKCVFTISSRKFLGFTVSQWGIEGNPDKIKTIMEIKSPKTMKEV